MSADKEIVSFWYNRKGFFTIDNIPTKSNKDAGILALRISPEGLKEIHYVGISCSITSNITSAADLDASIGSIIIEKFGDETVSGDIEKSFGGLHGHKDKSSLSRVIILGALPKSRKTEIVARFGERGVSALQMEDILFETLEQIDTQYYKNDIIRTLQLTKFLLLGEPERLASLLTGSSLNSGSRKELLSLMLDKKEFMRELGKTNVGRLGSILKNSGYKPKQLAEILENDILNNRTRKAFLDSLMEQKKMRKVAKRTDKIKKANIPLKKFI